jgi:polyhydroxyalkanoate synthesis repressor PhaR
MSDRRLIKKYANRRLYDTTEKHYIKLEDVERLVRDDIEFVVIDKTSQVDITDSTLLQVLASQEHSSCPMMSRNFLCDAIRAHGSPQQLMLSCYLEQSAKVFASQKHSSSAGTQPSRESLAAVASAVYAQFHALQMQAPPAPA